MPLDTLREYRSRPLWLLLRFDQVTSDHRQARLLVVFSRIRLHLRCYRTMPGGQVRLTILWISAAIGPCIAPPITPCTGQPALAGP